MKSWKSSLCFIAFCLAFLLIFKADLLNHFQQYNLFNFDGDFLWKFFEQPGGLLALAGAFLTQFCHYPLVGATLIAILLLSLLRLNVKVFSLNSLSELLGYIPSFFLLLFITRLDYSIYLQKTYGMLFSPILGFISSVGILALYRKFFEKCRWGFVFTALVIPVLYPLLGVYAIFGAVLIVLVCIKSKSNVWTNLAAAVLLGFAVPMLCANLDGIYIRINRHYAFFAGVPYMEFVDNFLCFVPLILTAVSLLGLPFLKNAGLKLTIALLTAALLLVGFGTNWDYNFHSVLKMERAVSVQDWDKVLKLARKAENPTRIQVLYRNLALYHKGQLTEKMFSYPDGAAELATPAYVPVSFICSSPVLYYCGMINTCERMSMEVSVSYCKSIHFYKYQAKVALITGEFELAQKYINVIAKNWFERKWVNRYRNFLSNPSEMDNDKEFAMLRPLMDFDGLDMDLGLTVEKSMFSHFSELNYTNEYLYEWQMAMLMIQKREYLFMQKFYDHYDRFPQGKITTGIAQTVALCAGISGDREMMATVASMLKDHTSILRNFSNLAKALNSSNDLQTPESVKWFKDRFGETYWFYYYFINGIESN